MYDFEVHTKYFVLGYIFVLRKILGVHIFYFFSNLGIVTDITETGSREQTIQACKGYALDLDARVYVYVRVCACVENLRLCACGERKRSRPPNIYVYVWLSV